MRYVVASTIMLSSTALNLVKANFVKNFSFIVEKTSFLESSKFPGINFNVLSTSVLAGRSILSPLPT